MTFDDFLDRAWTDHTKSSAEVAARLAEALPLVAEQGNVAALAQLAHHVWGEHLGDCAAGIAFLERLGTHPSFVAEGPSGAAVRRCVASLSLTAGDVLTQTGSSPSDRIRIGAMAAANLAQRDGARAFALFQQALDEAQRSGLGSDDPMNRALAVTANNLAVTLEEKPERSTQERALMILAAESSRVYWERAGTWLETERAEYRLAMTWVQAGDLQKAREHAQACLQIVTANAAPALERFFAWEALGTVAKRASKTTEHGDALAMARAAFETLEDADKGWCKARLDALAT